MGGIMQRARNRLIHQAPWIICALLLGILHKPAQATPQADSDKATALRIEAKAFEHGSGQPRNPEKAVELYCEAAHLGDAEAQYNLGWMYAMGRGIERDDSAAAYFFTLAAHQGDPLATRMLKQVGAAPDRVEALFAGARDAHVEAGPLKRVGHRISDIAIVLDHDDVEIRPFRRARPRRH